MIRADMHTHSEFSGDSKASAEGQVKAAIESGLSWYTFTDHLDLYMPLCEQEDGSIGNAFILDIPAYTKEVARIRDKYKDKISVFTGIELGLLDKAFPDYRRILNETPFDFVLGSIHTVADMDPYFPEYWKKYPGKKGVILYFETMLDCIESFSDFDSLAHLDYIIRYCQDEKENPVLRDYEYSVFGEIIDEVLKWVIKNDKALEVNTAGFKYGLDRPNPSPQVLKRYRELGGERITIGSDGHKKEHLFYDFDKTEELLISLGFKYYEVFKKRKPVSIRLGE